jgi:hypothetical protein
LSVLGSNFPAIKRVIETHLIGATCEPKEASIRNLIQDTIDKGSPVFNGACLDQLAWQHQEKKLVDAYKELLA